MSVRRAKKERRRQDATGYSRPAGFTARRCVAIFASRDSRFAIRYSILVNCRKAGSGAARAQREPALFLSPTRHNPRERGGMCSRTKEVEWTPNRDDELFLKCQNTLVRACVAPDNNEVVTKLAAILGAKAVREPTRRAMRAVLKRMGPVVRKPPAYKSNTEAWKKERSSKSNFNKWLVKTIALCKWIQRRRFYKQHAMAQTHGLQGPPMAEICIRSRMDSEDWRLDGAPGPMPVPCAF